MTKFETILALAEIKGQMIFGYNSENIYSETLAAIEILIEGLSEEFQSDDENCKCTADYVCMACQANGDDVECRDCYHLGLSGPCALHRECPGCGCPSHDRCHGCGQFHD